MNPYNRPVAIIGSWARDLPHYLGEAVNLCSRFGVIPVMVEQPHADDADAIAASLSLVDKADLYIGIVGDSYGPMLPGRDKSIGELEYERALELDIPRFVFKSEQEDSVEPNEESGRLADFIDRIKEKQAVTPVNSISEFGTLLTARLTPLKKGSGTRTGIRFGSRGRQKTALRLFVASPQDVQVERSMMPGAIESLNELLDSVLPVVVELWRWEVNATPAVGEPQALVNHELDKADIVLVIFWNRFGTLNSAGTTGTQGEVLRALERWEQFSRPQVVMYFCQRPALLNSAEIEQRLMLLKFRDSLSSRVLARDYEKLEEFPLRVVVDLFTTINRLFIKKK